MGGDADAVANGVKIKEKFSCWCYFYLWIGISTRFSSFVLQLEWVHLPSSLFRLIKGSSSVTLMLTQWISWRYHPPPLHHLVIMIFNALQTLTYKLAMYVWYEYYVLPSASKIEYDLSLLCLCRRPCHCHHLHNIRSLLSSLFIH